GQVIAQADGYTLAWAGAPKQPGDLTLRLSRDDTPVEGRIVDLEGKPIAGLRVSVLGASAPEKGDLSAFVKALESGETLYTALYKEVTNHLRNSLIGQSMMHLLPSAKTDADGRFRLGGFARDCLVELRIEGPSVETQNVYVLTRARPGNS